MDKNEGIILKTLTEKSIFQAFYEELKSMDFSSGSK